MGDTAATDSYRVLLSGGEGEIVEKKSRFIATIRKCETEEEAVAFIEEMKKKYWDARHNCSAFIIGSRGELTRCSDDGEPSGTAGRPMLEVLTGSGIRNIAVVVTRYFGGGLLGAGGLTRAYTKGAKDALDAAGISVVRRWIEVLLPCSYAQYERMKLETEGFGGVIAEADYGADIALTVLLPEERADAFLAHILDVTAGTVEGLVCGERFQDVPWRPPVWKEGGPHG